MKQTFQIISISAASALALSVTAQNTVNDKIERPASTIKMAPKAENAAIKGGDRDDHDRDDRDRKGHDRDDRDRDDHDRKGRDRDDVAATNVISRTNDTPIRVGDRDDQTTTNQPSGAATQPSK